MPDLTRFHFSKERDRRLADVDDRSLDDTPLVLLASRSMEHAADNKPLQLSNDCDRRLADLGDRSLDDRPLFLLASQSMERAAD